MRKHFVLYIFTLLTLAVSAQQDSLTLYSIDRQFSTEEVLSKLSLANLKPADFDDLSAFKASHEQTLAMLVKKHTRMHSSSVVEWSTVVALDTTGHGWPSALEHAGDGMDVVYKTGLMSDAEWPAGTSFLVRRK